MPNYEDRWRGSLSDKLGFVPFFIIYSLVSIMPLVLL